MPGVLGTSDTMARWVSRPPLEGPRCTLRSRFMDEKLEAGDCGCWPPALPHPVCETGPGRPCGPASCHHPQRLVPGVGMGPHEPQKEGSREPPGLAFCYSGWRRLIRGLAGIGAELCAHLGGRGQPPAVLLRAQAPSQEAWAGGRGGAALLGGWALVPAARWGAMGQSSIFPSWALGLLPLAPGGHRPGLVGLVKAYFCVPETTSRAIVPAPSRPPGRCQGRGRE